MIMIMIIIMITMMMMMILFLKRERRRCTHHVKQITVTLRGDNSLAARASPQASQTSDSLKTQEPQLFISIQMEIPLSEYPRFLSTNPVFVPGLHDIIRISSGCPAE